MCVYRALAYAATPCTVLFEGCDNELNNHNAKFLPCRCDERWLRNEDENLYKQPISCCIVNCICAKTIFEAMFGITYSCIRHVSEWLNESVYSACIQRVCGSLCTATKRKTQNTNTRNTSYEKSSHPILELRTGW